MIAKSDEIHAYRKKCLRPSTNRLLVFITKY